MKITSNDVLKWFFAGFVFWYVTTRMDIGREFVGDVSAIPQQLGVAEGLKSAVQFTK